MEVVAHLGAVLVEDGELLLGLGLFSEGRPVVRHEEGERVFELGIDHDLLELADGLVEAGVFRGPVAACLVSHLL